MIFTTFVIYKFLFLLKQETQEKHQLEIEQTNLKLQQQTAALQDKTSELHQVNLLLVDIEEQLEKLKV